MALRDSPDPGIIAALSAALLFGAGTPAAKILLADLDPWLLAGLLYLGSGAGLAVYRLVRRAPPAAIPRPDRIWLAGAIVCGGLIGPVLLMYGLKSAAASSASLLLNAEGVFTALLAWFVFHENVDRRIALGMAAILAGAVILSWPAEGAAVGDVWPALAIVGACLFWGIDNNLTRKVSLNDASLVASIKGVAAGAVNAALAFLVGAARPSLAEAAQAMAVGFLAYGVSLSLFVVALRRVGTARTGAYFSVAPFCGALLAIPLLHEPLTSRILVAGCLMGFGVWLHLTERHTHEHRHAPLEHEHEHVHDAHHQHEHPEEAPSGAKHSHRHRHDALVHRHPHFPDAHHRHGH